MQLNMVGVGAAKIATQHPFQEKTLSIFSKYQY